MPLAKAGDHVPPVCEFPPKSRNKFCGSELEQKFAVASVPAFAGGTTETVTDAVAFEHGGVPVKVYVYAPGASTAGLNIPVPLAKAGDHVPPGCAVTPKTRNKSCGLLLAHNVKAALFPAIGG